MIGAIIQARSNSTRLPNKVLKRLGEKTVLEHIIDRIEYAECVDKVVVATTVNKQDNAIAALCADRGTLCYRGSENHVLERFYLAAKEFDFSVIVRITADDPLKDPRVICRCVNLLLESGFDYVSNTIKPTFPEGIDVEAFTFQALEKAYENASLDSEKEHVTPYIWKNPQQFSIQQFENAVDLSNMRWTMDTEEDFQLMEQIYASLYPSHRIFYMEDVLQLLRGRPELMEINQGHIRNEGYLKSLEDEKRIENKK